MIRQQGHPLINLSTYQLIRSSMPKIVSGIIILFWLTMTGWFVKREILPALPSLAQPSYETLLKNNALLSDSKMGIYFLNNKIGEAVTSIKQLPTGLYQIKNKTYLNFRSFRGLNLIPPELKKPMELDCITLVTPHYNLHSLELVMNSSLYNYRATAIVKNDQLEITIRDGQTTRTERIDFPAQATVSNGLSPFLAMPNLSVGKEWTINVINPFSLTWETVKAYVEEKTTLEWPASARASAGGQGKTYEVYEVVLDYKGFKPRAWITPEGIILKQEVLTNGLYLIREE